MFLLEEIEGYGSGVVGLEQAHPFVGQAIFLDGQCFAIRLATEAVVLQAVTDHGLDFVALLLGECKQVAVVFLFDLLFHEGYEHGLLLAGVAFLVPSDAHEVRVDGAMPVLGHGHHEAAPAVAVDRGFQVVRMLALLLAYGVGAQYLLHFRPSGRVDEWLMASFVGCTSVGDDAFVVGLGQKLLDGAAANWATWCSRIGPCGEAACVEFLSERGDCPGAGGVCLKGPCDERSSDGVDFHGANFSIVSVELADIEIPDGGHAGCAAVSGFLVHALEYFCREVAAEVLTDGAENAVHKRAAGSFVDVFGS
ncbi:hypothetical protein P5V90_06870 [Mycobacteroides abscessus subsp. abscessus]|nr:hypothetical protein [Mycobacteroides abscessus]MDO3166678.1 hypothetical protein [Mycobacteroides abscessus subsp. abscessus]